MKLEQLTNNAMDSAIASVIKFHKRQIDIMPSKYSQLDQRVLDYFESVETSDEFVDVVAHDKTLLLEGNAYEMVARWSGDYDNILRDFLTQEGDCFTVFSDAGSVAVEHDGFCVQISNGFGDGETCVSIVDSSVNIQRLFPILRTVVSGSFDILDSDCAGSVIRHCEGIYGVYAERGFVVFEKWN